jgi:hypothetical protein
MAWAMMKEEKEEGERRREAGEPAGYFSERR